MHTHTVIKNNHLFNINRALTNHLENGLAAEKEVSQAI